MRLVTLLILGLIGFSFSACSDNAFLQKKRRGFTMQTTIYKEKGWIPIVHPVRSNDGWIIPAANGKDSDLIFISDVGTTHPVMASPAFKYYPSSCGDHLYFLSEEGGTRNLMSSTSTSEPTPLNTARAPILGYEVDQDCRYILYAIPNSRSSEALNDIYALDLSTGKSKLIEPNVVFGSPLAIKGEDFYYSRMDTTSQKTVIVKTTRGRSTMMLETPRLYCPHDFDPSSELSVFAEFDPNTGSTVALLSASGQEAHELFKAPRVNEVYFANSDSILVVLGDSFGKPMEILRLDFEGNVLNQLSIESIVSKGHSNAARMLGSER